jgi:Carboxypeptidase regulatory-like domain
MNRLHLGFMAVLTSVIGLTVLPKLHTQTLSSTAALSGTVSDPSGARIPKATVKLTDSEKGITRESSTGSAGEFSFALLPAGTYTLQATAQGFKTSKLTGIALQAGDAISENVSLIIGATEQITVSESGALLQTEDANVSTQVASKQLEELPLNLRNVVGLVMLNSSVNNQTQQQLLAAGGAEDTADQDESFLSFGGGYFGTTAFILDGGYNVAGGWGGVIYVPAVDDVQEFKIMNNSFSAEYGWSTGNVVNMITKSGTRDLHFVLDEYLRNSDLDANLYFNKQSNPVIPRSPDHRNQFGAAGGGPLYIPGIYKQRDKTFWFANYEGLRLNNAGNFSANVPTSAEEGGDFSAILNTGVTLGTDCMGNPIYQGEIYNPYSTTLETSGPCAGTYYRSPYPGNIIPKSGVGAIDARAEMFASGNYWPGPKNPNAATDTNFNVAASQATKSNEYGIRIDHNFNSNNRIYGRWSQKFESKSGLPDFYGSSDIAGPGDYNPDNRYSIAFGGSHVFSSSFVLNGNIEFNRWVEGNIVQSGGFKPSTLGLPSILDSYTPQFPEIGIGENYAALGPQGGFGVFKSPTNVGTGSIDLNKIFGPHSFSFGYMGVVSQMYGGRIEPTSFNFAQLQTEGPNPETPTAGTGDAFASFMAGAGTSGSTGFNDFPASQFYLHGGYIQDDWKVNRKLTLNLGFRYELQTPITARHNDQANFDFQALNPISTAVGKPSYGEIVYAAPGNRGLYNSNWDDLAPRFGFAYNVIPKLVLRGGWGLYYSRTYYGGGPAPGFSQSTPWVAEAPNGVQVNQPLAQAFATGIITPTGNGLEGLTDVGQGGGGVDPHHPDPRIKQYMFGFQYAITPNNLLDVNYVGNRGTRIILGSMNYGELNPNYLYSMGSALSNEVANPFSNSIMSGLGLPSFSCQNTDGTLPQAQLLEPYPEFCGGASAGQEPVGISNYNSLQATFTHRVTQGLTFMASYTYSKFLDDAGGPEEWGSLNADNGDGGSIRNYYDLKGDYSVDSTDVPQSLALNYVYALPIGRGQKFGGNMNAVENAVLGGWQVSGITHVQKGFPLSIGNGGADSASVWGGNVHASIVPGVSPKSGTCPNGQKVGTGICWFNGAAFQQTPAAQTAIANNQNPFGNANRYLSNLRAPGYVDWDLGIAKWFNLTEKFRLQFTAQMFNAFNNVNFDTPSSGIGNGNYGEVYNTQGARQTQLSLKLVR